MSQSWSAVPLGEVLTQSEEWIRLEPDREYQQVTVRMWGQGVIERDRVKGKEIKSEGRYVVRPGQFIMSRIDARNGAFGLVPETLDGGVVSNDFPSFDFNTETILPEFLAWLSKTRSFIEICTKASEGSTNRVRLKVDRFLEMPISLPLLSEQRRIVGRLEHLSSKIEQARGLRNKADLEVEALYASALSNVIEKSGGTLFTLDDVCLQITDGEHNTPTRVPNGEIPLVTAKNVRNGYLDTGVTDFVSKETAERCWRRCKPESNDILMVCVGATTGRVCRLVEPPDMVIVRSVALLKPNPNLLNSTYFSYALNSPDFQSQVWSNIKQAAQPGLYIGKMKRLAIPIPPVNIQHEIVDELEYIRAKANNLRQLQGQTRAELDALLPSILDKAFRGEL